MSRSSSIHSQWHDRQRYVGLHYDLHGVEGDTELGTRASPKLLVPMLELMRPDWVQTDCKGHPGYTSWFSKVADASVPPALAQDALAQWREATEKLGLPLHCHYSGLWDSAAGTKHPEWAVRGPDGGQAGAPFGEAKGQPTNDIMCPRGPYVDSLMIPQLLELIDRYHVDGFWVDGEVWGAKPCWCSRCAEAWRAETGKERAPVSADDPDWAAWMDFTRRSFETYVTRYTEAVHRHKPGVLVCSNWLQTFKNPGEPLVPTDWISGDNSWVFGLDQSRCEARFLSTRRKHWDIMLWAFYFSHGMGAPDSPAVFKPPQMLMQEAAVLASFGGNVQMYEHPPLRDGRLLPWRQKSLGEVVRFIRKRKALCQDAETIPQVAVLHSEHHLRATIGGPNLLWSVDTTPVEGATYALLENHYGVDVLDEWALLERAAEFPVIVVPEQHRLSDRMVDELRRYVESGGRLLLTGAELYDRFAAVIGAESVTTEEKVAYAVQANGGDVPLYSARWRLLRTTSGQGVGALARGCFAEGRITGHPAAVLTRVGKGRVLYVPAAVFKDFHHNRYPRTRAFVGGLMRTLAGRLDIQVSAPVAVDVALRRKGAKRIVHLVNRSSGIPNQPANGAIDEIPAVGPLTITVRLPARPKRVSLALEQGSIKSSFVKNTLRIEVASVHIHAAVVIEDRA
jgi:hypothetical protein